MPISSALGSSALLPAGLGFRNLIINGAMQVNQRTAVATAVTGITSSGYYTADRFRFGVSVGTWSQTTVADAPAGFKNSLKLQVTSAASPTAGQVAYLTQAIEGQNCQGFAKGTSSAKPLVLTFWVKTFQTGTFICQITDYTNSRMVCLPYTISASATWEQKTLYIPADATGTLANDNTGAFEVEFWLAAGSNNNSGTLQTTWGSVVSANQAVGQTNVSASTSNYWQITGVQLEQNYQPTPFEQRPIGVELSLCQRYYYRRSNVTGYNYIEGMGMGVNYSNSFSCSFQNPVEMRSAPVYALVSGTTGVDAYGIASSATYSAQWTTTKGGRISYATSGLTDYRPYFLIGNVDAVIQFSSEL